MTPDEIELLKANARAENSPWAWMKLGRLLGKREPRIIRADLLAWSGSVTTRISK